LPATEIELPVPVPSYTNYWMENLIPALPPSGGAMPLSGANSGLAGTSQLSSIAPEPGAGQLGPSPLRVGPAQLFPHFAYQLSYGNSLQSGPGKQADTFVHQLSPGMQLQFGEHWNLDYTPTLRFYSSSQFRDGVDHSVTLSGQTTYQDWTFGASQAYGSSSQPLIETGAQTDQEIYSTILSAMRRLNDQWSLELGANQTFRFVNGNSTSGELSDLREWSSMNWLNDQFNSWLGAGVGVGVGYDDLSLGSDALFEQLQGRVTLQGGRKLRLSLAGGAENRQFMNSPTPDMMRPIFSVSAQYQLFEPTTLAFTGSRAISPSYFQSSASEITALGGELRQRILQKGYLSVSGGYSSTSYRVTTVGPVGAPASDYQSTWLNIGLSTTIRRRARASVFFAQNYVSSGSAFYRYTTTQFGLELAYRF